MTFRKSKDVPADFPLDMLFEIWKDTDGHLRKAKQAVLALEKSTNEIVSKIASVTTPASRDIKDDNILFDSSAVWKWIKTSGLDQTEPNRKRINQIMELNSQIVGDKPVFNWQAIVHQIKVEFSA